MPKQKQSCLGWLASRLISLIVSLGLGALVMLVIRWIYPQVNPALYELLEFNQVPYAGSLLSALWMAVPFIFSCVFMLIGSLITARIGRGRQTGREA